MLLCGSGVGFSVQKHHVAKLPDFLPQVAKQREAKVFSVPDTIEGWADALGVLLATYMEHPEFPEWADYEVEFDFSLIRPKGSSLSSGVGKAPGPEPLKNSLIQIRNLLEKCIAERGRLRPIDADLQVPDTSKFTEHTGWKPEISFEKTMLDLLNYWREQVSSGRKFLIR